MAEIVLNEPQVAVMIAWPTAWGVTNPFASTVALSVAEDTKVQVLKYEGSAGVLSDSVPSSVSCCVRPRGTDAPAGESDMVSSTPMVTSKTPESLFESRPLVSVTKIPKEKLPAVSVGTVAEKAIVPDAPSGTSESV